MRRPERDNLISHRRITRRGLVLGAVQLIVGGGLAWRMHQLQVDQAEEFMLLAEENRINIRLLAPDRGLVYDRNGTLLADNVSNFRIVMVREYARDVNQVLSNLAEVIDLTEDEIVDANRELSRRSAFVPVTIKDRLSWTEISRVAVNAPALPGIFEEVGLSRHYPRATDFAHILGYVGPVSDYDLSRIDDQDPLLQIPKYQIGKTGVENKLEKPLRGGAGTRRVEVNAVGRVMRELGREEPRPGSDVQLTCDADLQAYVQARLEGQSASAIVMDVDSGDLLALGSAPSFDPNLFVTGISLANWRALNENEFRPLAAKSAQGTYPPGSTFKMVTALAALEAGVISPDETIRCTGHLDVADVRFHCWKGGGHGNVD
ncbi:MAG: penicillin-binding transpeptidase domain-containing protein, partial [Pseudomonadota bacterium]